MTYRGGPILAETDTSALFAASIGIVITCVFLVGLLERRDRTIIGMGVDSLAVSSRTSADLPVFITYVDASRNSVCCESCQSPRASVS
jgi:cation:H+ antiporter